MDPVTGLVVGCLSLTGKTIQAIHGGWELYTKYQDTEQSVSTLLLRLETIDSALTVLQTWLDSYLLHHDTAVEMATSLERAIRGCHMVLSWLDKLVEGVKAASTRDRIKYLWNEATISNHSSNLDSQVNALNLVVGILHLPTVVEQRKVLEKLGSVRVMQRAQQAASLYCDPGAGASDSIVSSKVGPDDPTYDLDFAFDHLVIDSQAYRKAFLRFVGDRQLGRDTNDAESTRTLREPDDVETNSRNRNSTSDALGGVEAAVVAQVPLVSGPPGTEHTGIDHPEIEHLDMDHYATQTHALQNEPHDTSSIMSKVSDSKISAISELESVSSVTDTTKEPQLTQTPSTTTDSFPLQPPSDNSISGFETKIHNIESAPILTEHRPISAISVWKVQSVHFPDEPMGSDLSIEAVGDLNGRKYLATLARTKEKQFRIWRLQAYEEHWRLVEEQYQFPLESNGQSYFNFAAAASRTYCVVFGEKKLVFSSKSLSKGEIHVLGLHPFRWLPAERIPSNVDFLAEHYLSDYNLYALPVDLQFSLSENFAYCITGSKFHLMDLRQPTLAWETTYSRIPDENGCKKGFKFQYCTKDQVFCFGSCYDRHFSSFCGHNPYSKLYVFDLDTRTLSTVACGGAIPAPDHGPNRILGIADGLLVLDKGALECGFCLLDVVSGRWYYLEQAGGPALPTMHRLGVWGHSIAIRDGLKERGDIWVLDMERVRSLLGI